MTCTYIELVTSLKPTGHLISVGHLLTLHFLCFQSIEFWQDGENSELNIAVKLYAKKDTHVVRAVYIYGFLRRVMLVSAE